MAKRKAKKQNYINYLLILILFTLLYSAKDDLLKIIPQKSYALTEIPEYNGTDYIIINNNNPYFTDEASETGRLSDSPRVTQQVIDRAGIGTEFLIPNPVLGLLGHAACI